MGHLYLNSSSTGILAVKELMENRSVHKGVWKGLEPFCMEWISSWSNFEGSQRAGKYWCGSIETWHDSYDGFSVLFCSCFLRTVLMMPSIVGGSMAWAREWPRSRMRMWTLPRRRWASWRSSTTCSSDDGEALRSGPTPEWCLLCWLYTYLPPQEKPLLLSKPYLPSPLNRKTFVLLKTKKSFRPRRGVCSEFVNKSYLFLIPRPLLQLPPATSIHGSFDTFLNTQDEWETN